MRGWKPIAILTVVGAVVPVLIAWHYGALGIPRNDDWGFFPHRVEFADSGTLDGGGWPAMNLVGLVVMSTPLVWVFGDSLIALQLLVVAFGVLGLYATYRLGRREADGWSGLFAALTVACVPLWGSVVVSYLTDVPAFAFAMLSLCVGASGIATRRPGLVSTAIALGLVGYTIREYAIVAPAAVVLATFPWWRKRAIALLALVIVFAAGFLAWRHALGGWGSQPIELPTSGSVTGSLHVAARSSVLVGLALAPCVLFAAGPKRIIASACERVGATAVAVVSTVTGVGLLYEIAKRGSSGTYLGPGDYVLPNGVFGTDVMRGVRPDLVPKPLFLALAILGAAGFVLFVCAVLARWRPSVVGYALVGSLAFMFFPLIGVAAYDRYLLLLIALGAVTVLDGTRRHATVGVGALALLGLVGLVFTLNAASFDGTRWEVAERAAADVGVHRVDGGFEWNGWHRNRTPLIKGVGAPERDFCVELRTSDEHPTVWGPFGNQVSVVTVSKPCRR